MKLKHTLIFICIFSFGFKISKAQQGGNYNSVQVEARVWKQNSAGASEYSDWRNFETRLVDNFKDFIPVTKASFTKYGSNPERKVNGTGFFRTEKIGDRWWIIDPEGFAGINIAINSVAPGNSDRNKAAFENKFGSKENWARETQKQLVELGFTGIGSWSSHDDFIKINSKSKTPVSYCINWNFMGTYRSRRPYKFKYTETSGYPKETIFAFDPEFPAFCEEHAKQLLKYKDDPNLFGYFSDNEIRMGVNNLDIYLKLENKNDPGYLAAKKWIDDKGITQDQITDQHRKEFLALIAEKYYSAVYNAIKKYDPNHLLLGTRLFRGEKNTREFMQVAGKYTDIISVNYYGYWTPSKEQMKNWTEWSGKPFIITEFYTKGMDTGFPNLSGAGWQVRTQEDRGKAYQNFCLGLLESKNCVGWHWFKYQDNDPANTKSEGSNTDSNKGILDNDYQFFTPLTDKMKQLNINRYKLIAYFDNLSSK